MKTLCLFFLFCVSQQLQCDKKEIKAHIGGEFIISCTYDRRFLYSKKYWCRGSSRNTCEILVDSDGIAKTKYTHRSHIFGTRRGDLYMKVTNLQTDDSGVYWIGIDKVYADIMTSVTLVVTEAPVSKPRLWPLTPLVDRLTCWGKPMTVRCGCARGTGIAYAWYQHTHHKDLLVYHSSDLNLHCSTVEKDSKYFCSAKNSISSEKSDFLSVQVLVPADNSCIYVVNVQDPPEPRDVDAASGQGQPIYDCADRMRTTTAETPPLTTFQTTMKIHSDTRDNQTDQNVFFSRTWCGFQLWYTLLRWGAFASLLIILCTTITCRKTRPKKYGKRKKLHFREIQH